MRVPGRTTVLVTLTAPSDRDQHCRRHRKCDGRRAGCVVCECTPAGGVDLGQWNRDHGRNWNRFCQDVRRLLGQHVEYFRGVELQGRGALHDHVLFRMHVGGVINVGALRALAIKHGFGHEVDVQAVADHKPAVYVAKYVSKSVDDRRYMPWADESGRPVPGNRRLRTWTASRRWGATMKDLRAAAVEWARSGAGAGERSEAPALLTPTAFVTQQVPSTPVVEGFFPIV